MNENNWQLMIEKLNSHEVFFEGEERMEIPTKYKDIMDCCNVSVKVGTTGYKGGDSGYGGRTLLKITDRGCTDMRASVNCSGYFDVHEIGIMFGGDTELECFIKALEFALETLKSQTE